MGHSIDLDEELRELFSEYLLSGPTDNVSAIFREAHKRGFLNTSHLKRTFASLSAARALPPEIDEKLARYFVMWLEVINQPYFKPVITERFRLNRMVDILADVPYVDLQRPGLALVDFGAGQPPYTTIDLAERFPHIHVYGIELYLAAYMIRRPNDAYALFDENERLRAVQVSELDLLHTMIMGWNETEQLFTDTLRKALPVIRGGEAYFKAPDGSVVTRNPTQLLKDACANPNVFFHLSDGDGFCLPTIENQSVDILWSFNCLLHYGLAQRMLALKKLCAKVKADGIVMEGYTSPQGRHGIYSIWQKGGTQLVMREFGFSMSNLHHPLWPLHERDPQVEMMNCFISLIKLEDTLRKTIACEFAARGCISPDSKKGIVQLLKESGYSARIRNDEFVVVDGSTAEAATHLPILDWTEVPVSN